MIGTTLDGKYRVESQLGSGAMGAVYLAEHMATGRKVAVKVISTGDVKKDEKLVTRFQREARAAGSIETQHIAQVLDAGVDRDSGWPFLVMELLVGEDLHAIIKRIGPLPPDVAMRIAAQCCLGLQKAHDKGVVHRDIKPANVFLAKRDAGEVTVKLLDFGIAKVKSNESSDADSQGLTKTGAIVGSPLYMSPEQARGNASMIDHRTDIWSLGAMLYQVLSGRTPFAHIEALGELILEICSKPPPPVQDFAPWVPPEVAEIVHKCLLARREDRFQSADEMLTAVRTQIPYGWGINEDMLVAVTPEVLARPAQRLVMSFPPPVGSVPPPPPIVDATAAVQADTGASSPNAATTGALAQSQSNVAPPKRAPLFAGIGIAAAALAVGGFVALRSQPQPTAMPAPSTTAIEARTEPTTLPVAATAPPSASVAVTPADPTLRRVKVVILPKDATVEVEGAKTPAPGGLLEIAGTLGSVHRVHVAKGKLEATTDVIVTENGAAPPSIELSATPKAATSAAASASAKAPPPAPTTLPGVQEKFE